MKQGTKSLLFGAHQFLIHPIFVARAWKKLYGRYPRKLPTWIAFIVHDWGYWGCETMDGPDGTLHPHRGACIVHDLFDAPGSEKWFRFCAGHSRTYAAMTNLKVSPLMPADKFATVLMPLWLYVTLCWLSGEWQEYLARWIAAGTYPGEPNIISWARCLQANWSRFSDVNAPAGQAYGGE